MAVLSYSGGDFSGWSSFFSGGRDCKPLNMTINSPHKCKDVPQDLQLKITIWGIFFRCKYAVNVLPCLVVNDSTLTTRWRYAKSAELSRLGAKSTYHHRSHWQLSLARRRICWDARRMVEEELTSIKASLNLLRAAPIFQKNFLKDLKEGLERLDNFLDMVLLMRILSRMSSHVFGNAQW